MSLTNEIRQRRMAEYDKATLTAELAKARADLDYVTMMTGVEVPMPEDGGEEIGTQPEIRLG